MASSSKASIVCSWMWVALIVQLIISVIYHSFRLLRAYNHNQRWILRFPNVQRQRPMYFSIFRSVQCKFVFSPFLSIRSSQ